MTTARDGTPDVVTAGETMTLLLAAEGASLRDATHYRRLVGGAESNVAVGLCRLGHRTRWISRVGDDGFGQAVVARLRGEGVDVRCTVDPGAPTGLMLRTSPEAGGVEVVYQRAGSAASRLGPDDVTAVDVEGARWVFLTGILPALSPSCRALALHLAALAADAGTPVAVDPNMRRRLWSEDEARPVLRALVERADLVLPGADEAELIAGSRGAEAASRAIARMGPRLVVTKCGADGVIVATPDGAVLRLSPCPVARVVDPVGAGDAFAAGVLSGLLEALPIEVAAQRGARCAAAALAVRGDMEGLPLRSEVESAVPEADVRR